MVGNHGAIRFDLEKKASAFLDMLYCSLGGEIIKDAPKRKFDDWDKVVKFENITYKIEEKTRVGLWEDLLVELIEDLKTGDLGWFYQTKADKIIYCFYESEKAKEPESIYALSVEKMRNFVFEHTKKLIRKSNISSKGYGLTLNIFIPLTIAKKIYPIKARDRQGNLLLADKA